MLETELKCIITREVYERVMGAFVWDCTAEQINYYYTDEHGALRENRVMARVRVKNGVSVLQVKARKSDDGALQVCEENEYEINGVPEEIPPETARRVTGLGVGSLFKMGCSKTLRSSLMWDAGTEICLDKTEYFGVTDYEIEVEYTSKPKKELLDKLAELGVIFKEKPVGKFSRFLKMYEELNQC